MTEVKVIPEGTQIHSSQVTADDGLLEEIVLELRMMRAHMEALRRQASKIDARAIHVQNQIDSVVRKLEKGIGKR